MHISKEAAKKSGFDTPIVQGLCTYGTVFRLVDEYLGDGIKVNKTGAMFTAPVFPEDTLIIELWKEIEGRLLISVKVDDKVVMRFAYAEYEAK